MYYFFFSLCRVGKIMSLQKKKKKATAVSLIPHVTLTFFPLRSGLSRFSLESGLTCDYGRKDALWLLILGHDTTLFGLAFVECLFLGIGPHAVKKSKQIIEKPAWRIPCGEALIPSLFSSGGASCWQPTSSCQSGEWAISEADPITLIWASPADLCGEIRTFL